MKATTIAGFARAGGVGVETIRYYQRRGLLETPERARGGIRYYGAEDLRRLRFIRSAQAAGFTLEQIVELIALDATNDRPRARILARERIAALNAEIKKLETARDALRKLERSCSSGSKGPCPILSTFESGLKPA
jgi:MerR family mercuric resistance operon transcriptional regulator